MSELEEAREMLIKYAKTYGETFAYQKFMAKYHPKDELREMWESVWKGHSVFELDRDFNKAEELGLFDFRSDQKLKQAIEYFPYGNNYTSEGIIARLQSLLSTHSKD